MNNQPASRSNVGTSGRFIPQVIEALLTFDGFFLGSLVYIRRHHECCGSSCLSPCLTSTVHRSLIQGSEISYSKWNVASTMRQYQFRLQSGTQTMAYRHSSLIGRAREKGVCSPLAPKTNCLSEANQIQAGKQANLSLQTISYTGCLQVCTALSTLTLGAKCPQKILRTSPATSCEAKLFYHVSVFTTLIRRDDQSLRPQQNQNQRFFNDFCVPIIDRSE